MQFKRKNKKKNKKSRWLNYPPPMLSLFPIFFPRSHRFRVTSGTFTMHVVCAIYCGQLSAIGCCAIYYARFQNNFLLQVEKRNRYLAFCSEYFFSIRPWSPSRWRNAISPAVYVHSRWRNSRKRAIYSALGVTKPFLSKRQFPPHPPSIHKKLHKKYFRSQLKKKPFNKKCFPLNFKKSSNNFKHPPSTKAIAHALHLKNNFLPQWKELFRPESNIFPFNPPSKKNTLPLNFKNPPWTLNKKLSLLNKKKKTHQKAISPRPQSRKNHPLIEKETQFKQKNSTRNTFTVPAQWIKKISPQQRNKPMSNNSPQQKMIPSHNSKNQPQPEIFPPLNSRNHPSTHHTTPL